MAHVLERKMGVEGYWIPFNNPLESDKALDELCRMKSATSGWRKAGLMPHWVEFLLELGGTKKPRDTIEGAVTFVNKYLEAHPDVEVLHSKNDRKIGLVKRIA